MPGGGMGGMGARRNGLLAVTVEDLRAPPGHRLHRLGADRAGQWSISVNDQFRICFVWGDHGPEQVEFVDYH
jgi:proteic killer suppression protein